MREIERSNQFRRDYKRELKGRRGTALPGELAAVVEALANDQPLPPKYRDHALTGNFRGYRDIHVRPDLVLIYVKPDIRTLQLVRLGSHSELFD